MNRVPSIVCPLALSLAVAAGAMPTTTAAADPSISPANPAPHTTPNRPHTMAPIHRSEPQPDMTWWREARFGMFIHWGLYAVPAGKWGDKDTYGEWIRDSAKIPLAEYDRFAVQFNPTKFNAADWVKLAQDAGMGYMVITSKHHDGFCLFDSRHTDFDVMSTPFKRDIIKELADACAKSNWQEFGKPGKPPVRFGLYHSIMDWHHPHYVPRRPWEKADRPETGADFEQYITYMKSQIEELLTKYGPIGVLWFDGQWEGTWNNQRGLDLQQFVRSLQPRIIINSRVGRGGGAYGLEADQHGERLGDYGTPEQFIPDSNPGIDWETCMTMNRHWGYNAADKDFKSTADLIQKLCDIASKGGNFLLNVGPTAEGEIPHESVQRLKEIGAWMDINALAIRGTRASPIDTAPAWGRITQRPLPDGNTRLYLHIFELPPSKQIEISGLLNTPIAAGLLAPGPAGSSQVAWSQSAGVIRIDLSSLPISLDQFVRPVGVITLDVKGTAESSRPPDISAFSDQFIGQTDLIITSHQRGAQVYYTLDGTPPTLTSFLYDGKLQITDTTLVTARAFRDGLPITSPSSARFTLATLRPAAAPAPTPSTTGPHRPGLAFTCYEGDFDALPAFESLAPTRSEIVPDLTLARVTSDDTYAVRFSGFIHIPVPGVYTFSLASDDGSRMFLGGDLFIDHDGLHSEFEKHATVALDAGLHPVRIEMFEKSGGAAIGLKWATPTTPKQRVPASVWFHD